MSQSEITDKDRIDFIQASTKGYGLGWIFRESSRGRGMRLHESSQNNSCKNVRDAIDTAIIKSKNG